MAARSDKWKGREGSTEGLGDGGLEYGGGGADGGRRIDLLEKKEVRTGVLGLGSCVCSMDSLIAFE